MIENEMKEIDIEEAYEKIEESLAENESLEILTEEERGLIACYRSVSTVGKFCIIHYCVEAVSEAGKLDAVE